MQEAKIAHYSLTKDLNPTMAIFLLMNNHGYRDRHDLDIKQQSTYDLTGLTVAEKITLLQLTQKAEKAVRCDMGEADRPALVEECFTERRFLMRRFI